PGPAGGGGVGMLTVRPWGRVFVGWVLRSSSRDLLGVLVDAGRSLRPGLFMVPRRQLLQEPPRPARGPGGAGAARRGRGAADPAAAWRTLPRFRSGSPCGPPPCTSTAAPRSPKTCAGSGLPRPHELRTGNPVCHVSATLVPPLSL